MCLFFEVKKMIFVVLRERSFNNNHKCHCPNLKKHVIKILLYNIRHYVNNYYSKNNLILSFLMIYDHIPVIKLINNCFN